MTNVDDDGTVPRQEKRDLARGHRWAQAGSVSEGVLAPSCAFPRPDLTASALRVGETPGERRLTVRIGNGGARVVGPGVPVSFYDGDPRLGSVRLGTVETATYLPPGRFEDVELVLPRTRTTRGPVVVSADDAGGLVGRIVESDEENNLYDTGQALVGAGGLPDLAVSSVDVSRLVGGRADPRRLRDRDGGASATSPASPVERPFEVAFFEDRDGDGALGAADAVLGRATVGGVGAFSTLAVEASLSGSVLFRGSPVRAFVDSAGAVDELDETNNVGRSGETCQVRPAGRPFSLREEWAWTAASAAGVLSTPVAGDLDGDGVADVVFVTMRTGSTGADGQLRAVSGRTGQMLFSVLDLAHWSSTPRPAPPSATSTATAGPRSSRSRSRARQLLAFEADGTLPVAQRPPWPRTWARPRPSWPTSTGTGGPRS